MVPSNPMETAIVNLDFGNCTTNHLSISEVLLVPIRTDHEPLKELRCYIYYTCSVAMC